MAPRFSIPDLTPDLYKAQYAVALAIGRSAVPERLRLLIDLQVSLINDCTFCIDMHSKAALNTGETRQRLDALPGWKTSPLFDPGEKAAFAWAEALTVIDHAGLDDLLAGLRRHFSEEQISALTMTVATINAWNRIAIPQHNAPVARDSRETAAA